MTRRRPDISLREDDEGAILTIFAIMLAIFIGVAALAYDFGRLAATQSELQSFADNVALAAAGELNARPDSIERAEAAAAALVSDWQTYGEGSNTLGPDDFTLTFYAARPDDAGTVEPTTDSLSAGYVTVRIADRTVRPIFGAAFSALTGQDAGRDNADAYAVAGFTSYGCNISPMMFCAPSADFRADENVGMAVRLRTGGNVGTWGPGAFGFLDPSPKLIDPAGVCAGLNGSKLDICLISAVGDGTSCIDQRGITISPGQRVGNYEAALNVRFDIYEATANGLRDDPLYPPAPNVLSGYLPPNGQCISGSSVPDPDSVGLPPDDCQVAGTCGAWGDGDWSLGRQTYIDVNYDGTDPFPTAETRFDYYMAEIEAQADGGALSGLLGDLILPSCSSTPPADPARRVFVAASVDCIGNAVSPGAEFIPVIEFVEVFMISPIGLDGTRDVWVEIVGSIESGGDAQVTSGIVRDVIQLYD